MFINLLVASSNLYGLRALMNTDDIPGKCLLIYAIGASILFHLSETKHNLPGINPLNKITWKLLWFDRIGAILLSLYLIYISKSKSKISLYIVPGIHSLLILYISEQISNPILFGIIHSVWHILAFGIAYQILK